MSLQTLITTADIFDGLSEVQIGLVANLAQQRAYKAGATIMAEGTPGDGLYLIVSGAVEVRVDPSRVSKQFVGEPYPIATLRPGQIFGEISLVDDGMRSATVVATQYDTRVVFIPRADLLALCDGLPELGYRLMRNLAADIAMKIRATDLKVRDAVYYATTQVPKGNPPPTVTASDDGLLQKNRSQIL